MSARQVQNNRLVARKTAIAQLVAQLFVGGALVGAAMPASAASCTWNTTAGNWATLTNWLACATGNGNPAATPGAADAATIGATGVVTINTGQSIFTLSNAGTITIDAFGLNLVGSGSTTNTGTINVGGASTANIGVSGNHNINNTGGTINIANGSVVNQFGSTITGGTINSTGTGALVGFASGSNFLSGVTLNGTLDLATNGGIERVINGLTLGGTISLNGNGVVAFQGTNIVSGGGTIVLGNTGASNRIAFDGTGTTTLAAGTTIRGENGSIGAAVFVGGTQALVNNGTISADVSGGTININTVPVTNNGTLSAQNGGTLLLSSNLTGGALGQIVAGAGSTVLQNGATLAGTLNTSGSGRFAATTVGANFLSGVTLNGNLDLATAQGIERVTAGGLVLNGTINLNNSSVLAFNDTGGLSGNGTIVLGNTGSSNRIALDGTGTTTLAAGTTIRGENGTIGAPVFLGGAQALVNNGTISADVSGGTINLSTAPVTNNGTLSALNGGTLLLSSNLTGGAAGQIVAGAGSTVLQNGVTLAGTLNTSGGGRFAASASGTNFLNGVTLNGNLDLATATGIERITAGGLVLNGTINLNNNSVLTFEGNGGLSGNATIVLGNTGASNRIGLDGPGTTTLAAGTTIRGENGTIGAAVFVGGAQALVNNGTISADVSGGTINLSTAPVTNNGTLSALNGGTLQLSSNVTGNLGSQIVAGTGSTVLQNGATLAGTLNISGSGRFAATASGTNFLNGVTLNGNLDLATATGFEQVTAGGLVLNGTINLNNNSVLAFNGTGGLSGNGTIVLGNTGSSNRIALDGTGTTTLAAGTTIRGENGTIGAAVFVGGAQALVNNGTISADVSGGTINLSTAPVTNNGTLSALNGGTLMLSSNVTGNPGGQIVAGAGSTVLQNGVTLAGTINTSGSGRFAATASGSNFLNGVTLNGNLDLATAAGIERVTAGGLVLNGTINLNNNSVLAFNGTGGLSGNGTIVLGNTGASNRIGLDGPGTTTFAAGTTIRGHSGTIGNAVFVGGAQTLVNNGTINADVAGGTITISGAALNNNGLVRAQAGTLNVSTALTGTGTLQVDATGVMNLAAGAKTQGTLAMGSAGSAINLNTGNLTLNTDYTNVGASTGNTFNRRAGVTGAGLIVAGGNAAQAITGAGVTNGNTANATLTLGNVRVGATTFNYQVANTGTTGPALRGAIQTNVNGGNLTDGRLSGAGVTASNYNTGAPGSNTGNLGVTFTAASAGLLAPLSGQVLNLRSNFENIADQKLNIVLGAGAAAFNAAVGSAVTPVTVANQRIGGAASATLNISNTAAAGPFSEDLNVSVTSVGGNASGSGSIAGRLAGSNNTGAGAVTVGVATGSEGAKTGTVQLAYQTAGAVNGVSNGLGTASVGSQTITVNGNVYKAATGAIQTPTLNFGNVQTNTAVGTSLVIRNTAIGASGFVEDLNAAFATGIGTDSRITGSGSLNGILALSNSTGANGAMNVSVNTSTAGSVNGTIRVNYTSAGAVNGASNTLGTLAAGFEDYAALGTIVTANVIDQAKPVINGIANPGSVSVNLGNVRLNSAASQNLSVLNQATGNQQAVLNASIATNGAPVTAGGSFSGLAPGATSTGLQVGLNTSTAGNQSGSATVSAVSDITAFGNCAPNCTLNLAPQTVNVTGAVYRLAAVATTTITPSITLAARVGAAAPSSAINITNNSVDGFTEGLNVVRGATAAGFTSSGGPITNLAANASSSAIGITLNTGTAGTFSGNQVLALASNGTITSNSDVALGNVNVALNGKVYTTAVAQVNTAAINFGIVHVGDVVALKNISVTNNAAVTALNDTLVGSISATGPFSGSGTLGAGVAATATDATSLKVGLNTATAGIFSGGTAGTANLLLASHNPDMADLALSTPTVALNAQVNNYANLNTIKVSGLGSFTRSGNIFTLDFGNVLVGSGLLSASLNVLNDVTGPADDADGSYCLPGAPCSLDSLLDFALTGFNPFADVGAGATASSVSVGLSTAALGLFQDEIQLAGFGHNTSGFRQALDGLTLRIRGNVVSQGNTVPEPGTLALLLMAAAGAVLAKRRKARAFA